MNDAICGGKGWEARRVEMCPIEKKRRRFYVWGAAWYAAVWTCLGCGDSWSDGELGYRPFERGWRAKAIAKAKRDWAAAGNWRASRERFFEELKASFEATA